VQAVLFASEALRVGAVIHDDVPTFRVDHMPYGGTKESGVGREGLPWALADYTEPRTLVLRRR
jgi:acyl-CoA reductase-like NAD-dependent aldehyde dehydrogenase